MSEAVELRATLARVVDEWQTVAALQGVPLGIPAVYATSLVNDLLASLTGEGEPVACPDREAVARTIYASVHHLMRVSGLEAQAAYECAADAILALSASGPTIPEGYKLVPVEPTEAMILAGWIDKEDVDPEDIYAAMLSASGGGE